MLFVASLIRRQEVWLLQVDSWLLGRRLGVWVLGVRALVRMWGICLWLGCGAGRVEHFLSEILCPGAF